MLHAKQEIYEYMGVGSVGRGTCPTLDFHTLYRSLAEPEILIEGPKLEKFCNVILMTFFGDVTGDYGTKMTS